jgi:hypothetical protein
MPRSPTKQKEEEWDLIRTLWFIRKGFPRGIVDNLRYVLDKQYYSQLKHLLMACQNVIPFQILEHLNDQWCPLDVKAKKSLKDVDYTKWDGYKHLTAFDKHLDNNQRALIRSNITIADKDKLQFFLEQMYDSNHFNKNNMLKWEKQPNATKTDYDSAKDYFEALVKTTTPTSRSPEEEPPDATSTSRLTSWQTTVMKSVSTLPKLRVCQLVQPTPMQQQTSSKQWRCRSKHSPTQLHSLQQQRRTPTQMPAEAMEAAIARANDNK